MSGPCSSSLSRRRLLGTCAGALSVPAMLALITPEAAAQGGRRTGNIRDEEIERTLKSFGAPLADAAGVPRNDFDIALIFSTAVNAFVAGGQTVFVHTGLITDARNAGEILGVLAHEMGHIAGGHVPRIISRAGQIAKESLALAAILCGAAIGASRGAGAASCGVTYANIVRSRTAAAQRALEGSADQSALRYLEASKLPASGLVSFMERLAATTAGVIRSDLSYLATHPFPAERAETIRDAIRRDNLDQFTVPRLAEARFQRIKAKTAGYTQPQSILAQFGPNEGSFNGLYARAMALYRQRQLAQAATTVDRLIRAEPDNPYLHELKGQILLESGQIAQSLGPLRRALEELPDSALIAGLLGHALVQGTNTAELNEAVRVLTRASQLEPGISRIHYSLAIAYGKLGDRLRADVNLAEQFLIQLDLRRAIDTAKQVEEAAAFGSPIQLQAQDIQARAKALQEAMRG